MTRNERRIQAEPGKRRGWKERVGETANTTGGDLCLGVDRLRGVLGFIQGKWGKEKETRA